MNADDSTAAHNEALAEMEKDTPDFSRALFLVWTAINAGNGNAAYTMATWYLHGKPPYIFRELPRAIELLEFAVRARVAPAAKDLAQCFETGMGVAVNRHRALELYQLAESLRHE